MKILSQCNLNLNGSKTRFIFLSPDFEVTFNLGTFFCEIHHITHHINMHILNIKPILIKLHYVLNSLHKSSHVEYNIRLHYNYIQSSHTIIDLHSLIFVLSVVSIYFGSVLYYGKKTIEYNRCVQSVHTENKIVYNFYNCSQEYTH